MGCRRSKPTGELSKRELRVGTLNYCGIMNNPFEFYCQDYQRELNSISLIFESLLPLYFKDYHRESFKWNMGKIDVKIRTGRYSPLFMLQAGIQNQRFITKSRFSQFWDQAFDEEEKKMGEKFTNEERECAKQYDFIAFHALLIFVYQIHNLDELIKQNAAPYLKKIRPFFQLTFLDQHSKLDIISKNYEKMQIDILFIQQYSRQFQKFVDGKEELLKVIDSTKDTMIVAKKDSFRELRYIETVLTKKEIESLNWAGRSSLVCLDNTIIINAHLTSKAVKNKPQIEQMKTSLVKLRKTRPQYHIILGGDLNSFLPPSQELSPLFQMYPDDERCITTAKKRTMMQAQFNKSNKVVRESKDKIITSLKLKDTRVSYINQAEPKEGGILPLNEHPFDHYLVLATVYKQ